MSQEGDLGFRVEDIERYLQDDRYIFRLSMLEQGGCDGGCCGGDLIDLKKGMISHEPCLRAFTPRRAQKGFV